MSQFAWMAFVCACSLGFAYFVFAKRNFDFLAIAYIGAMFYFAPLLWGRVLPASAELTSTIQPDVYWIATGYVLGLVLAGVISQLFVHSDGPATSRSPLRLSVWYLILSILGLLGSLISSHGAIINADKAQALKQIGYFYVLFEVAASLLCISAVVERWWRGAAAGAGLLLIDLLVGFRVFTILTSLGVALALLMRHGRIRLYSKIPTYGMAALALVTCMLFVHSVRFAIFDAIAMAQGVPRVTEASEMRGDTIQYGQALTQRSPTPTESTVVKWVSIPLRLFEQSEPFVIQATLVGTVQKNLSCEASNILKSISLLVPPGLVKFLPNNSFPPTFYDEYQPILYPNITYGTGGNIWAEMFCRFDYAGVAIFGLLLILTLIGLHRLILRCPSVTIAPIVFGGVVLAFYIHRNDLHYTLVMLRQAAIVFILARGLSFASMKIRKHLRNVTGVRA
jgi:hypothetical protein